MTVAIVDYGSGNLHSAAKAFERAARESGRDQPIVVTGDPDAVRRADRIVLPGVGAFADCRRGLDAVEGMIEALAPLRPHPLLKGIAVGPQGLHGYFVHSYHLKVADRHDLVAEADYGGPVTAMVARETYAGTQFHPEKSQRLGLALIANFLQWAP